MSSASDKAFAYIVGVEGGLSMDPKDPGNWTGGRPGVGELHGSKYGVSAAAHPDLDIASLTLEGAQHLFQAERWEPIRGDALPFSIALCLADDAYNHGTVKAVKTLQHALGVTIDGLMGEQSVAAARAANQPGLVILFQAYRALEYASDPNESRYGLDWFRDRVLKTALVALGCTVA